MAMMTKEELIAFEDRIKALYFDNKLPFLFHLSGGNENELINIFHRIAPDDYVLSNHRSHYHALLHGIEPDVLEDRILNGRSMFIYDREKNFFCSAIIGGTPAIAVGIAWALKQKGSEQHVWCFIGDGTEDSGHLFEAVRYAEGWDLPVTFIIECNDRSVEATNAERWGTQGNFDWSWTTHVIKYDYKITYPHMRAPGMIDLSKTKAKTDDEYFPVLYPEDDLKIEPSPPDISYRDALVNGMQALASDGAVFIGYNVVYGDAGGTIKGVPDEQKIETPVAENLMAGLAIGMSFEGFRPVLFLERHDFMLVAADAIVNHIDKIERISHGEFTVPVVIRAGVARGGPFYSGPTHSQDFTSAFREMVSFPVIDPVSGPEMDQAMQFARKTSRPVMIIERKL
jgi:Dehydrogenase E1 component/Transketolase, pyrimidine binding domain